MLRDLIGDMTRSLALPGLKHAAGWLTRLLPIPQPMLLVGPGASARLGRAVGGFGHRCILLVTDAEVARLGLPKALCEALSAAGAPFVVFDGITADAPIEQVEQGIALFGEHRCDAIVACGGGSVIDAAKAIGLAAANRKHPRELVGYFRGLRPPPPLYAVPTTAGTGSEVTVAAVVADEAQHRKLVIADTRIVPRIAALDATLMTGLPPAITAATGMDALTHAVEAYIGHWGTAATDRWALAAVGMIFDQLPIAFSHGADLAAREQMALASTCAGLAFTRANVGNVHAIAHQLGALYHLPHGLANAIMLPPVLRFCAAEADARLAALALPAGAGRPGEPALAAKFIGAVEAMNRTLGIPDEVPGLREADIPALAAAACREADFNYPVPRRMTIADCEALLRGRLPARPKRSRAARTAKPARPARNAPAVPRRRVGSA